MEVGPSNSGDMLFMEVGPSINGDMLFKEVSTELSFGGTIFTLSMFTKL